MNSNNGGTNQVGEQQDALYLACQSLMQWNAKYPSKAYTDYKIAVAADKELSEIIKSIGIAMNTTESYAASRSVGYSLERVKEIAMKYSGQLFSCSDQYKEHVWETWSKTDKGKSLLGSVPVVQDWKTIQADILDMLYEANGTGAGTDIVIEYFKKLLESPALPVEPPTLTDVLNHDPDKKFPPQESKY